MITDAPKVVRIVHSVCGKHTYSYASEPFYRCLWCDEVMKNADRQVTHMQSIVLDQYTGELTYEVDPEFKPMLPAREYIYVMGMHYRYHHYVDQMERKHPELKGRFRHLRVDPAMSRLQGIKNFYLVRLDDEEWSNEQIAFLRWRDPIWLTQDLIPDKDFYIR